MSIHRIAKYVASAAAAVLVVFVGCNMTQSEGVRCNPTLASGETDCNGGLACTQPALCSENYCCPVDSTGDAAPSSNPYCQTGCNGGAAARCNAGVNDAGECAFACANDPSDLVDPGICGAGEGGGTDGGVEASSEAGPVEAGGSDAAKDAQDAGATDGGATDGGADGDIDGASDGSADGAADGSDDGAGDGGTD